MGNMTNLEFPHLTDHINRGQHNIITKVANKSSIVEIVKLEECLSSIMNGRQTTNLEIKRCKAVLAALQNKSLEYIAEICEVSERTVRNWLNRFLEEDLGFLKDRPRSGRPTKFNNELSDVLDVLLVMQPRMLLEWQKLPPELAHELDVNEWSNELLAKVIGVSESSIRRYQEKINNHNRKSDSFCHSSDCHFIGKTILVDLVYRLGASNLAYVFCFDEKPCIQAIKRELILSAYGELRVSDRYERMGTIHLLGMLNFCTSEITGLTCKSKDTETVISFFRDFLSKQDLGDKPCFIVMDNLPLHSKVQESIEAEFPVKFIYTATNSSWQNLIEAYFSKITKGAIANRSFDSVESLVQAINKFIFKHNQEVLDAKTPNVNWNPDILKFASNRINLMSQLAPTLPEEAIILSEGANISLNNAVKTAIGLQAKELYSSENILTGVLISSDLFTEEVVKNCKQSLNLKGSDSFSSLPLTAHGIAAKRLEALSNEWLAPEKVFSSKVLEAYSDSSKAAELIKELTDRFSKPYKSPTCQRITQAHVIRAHESMEAAETELKQAISNLESLSKDADPAFIEEIRIKVRLYQRKLEKRNKRLQFVSNAWEESLCKAQVYLSHLKKALLKKLDIAFSKFRAAT